MIKESIHLKDVYTISERDVASANEKSRWTRVGVGFVNRDNSINVVLDAIPINGRLQIRDRQQNKVPARSQSKGYESMTHDARS